jgi:hypothetical protein
MSFVIQTKLKIPCPSSGREFVVLFVKVPIALSSLNEDCLLKLILTFFCLVELALWPGTLKNSESYDLRPSKWTHHLKFSSMSCLWNAWTPQYFPHHPCTKQAPFTAAVKQFCIKWSAFGRSGLDLAEGVASYANQCTLWLSDTQERGSPLFPASFSPSKEARSLENSADLIGR